MFSKTGQKKERKLNRKSNDRFTAGKYKNLKFQKSHYLKNIDSYIISQLSSCHGNGPY